MAAVQVEQCSERDRFHLDLEFVQCLASPEYLNWLAQRGYFDDPAFLRYLKYLKYWQRSEYSSFVMFPQCLQMLNHLEDAKFRNALKRKDIQFSIAWQQDRFFRFYRFNRLQEALDAMKETKQDEDMTDQAKNS